MNQNSHTFKFIKWTWLIFAVIVVASSLFLVYLVKVAFKIKQTANTNANLDIIDTGYFETMCMVNLSTMCMVNLSNTSVKQIDV